MNEEEALQKLEAMRWKSLDERMKKEGVWKKFYEDLEKILKPVLARNKKWREESIRNRDIIFYNLV